MPENPVSETKSRLTQSLHWHLWQHRLLFALLFLLVAVLIRLPNFKDTLWYDEVVYTFMRLKPNSINWMLFQDVHPFLYTLFMRGWIELFGDSEIAMRLPALLFGLASLGVTFALARNLFNRHIAFLATVLMALSPVHIWYSQDAKNNMLLLLLTVLSMYGLQRAWEDDRWQHWLLFIVASILALWTNHFSLWVIWSAFLWLWLRVLWDRGGTRLKWAVISSTVVALAYLPVALLTLFQIESMGRSYLRPFTLGEVYKLFLIYLSHGNTLRTISPWAPFSALGAQPWGFFLIEGFFILLLCRGLFLVGRSWLSDRKKPFSCPFPVEAGSELLLVYFLIPPIFLLLASYFYPQIYVERSMITLLPPFMILLACGVLAFRKAKWRYIVLCVLLLLNCWSLFNLWVAKAGTWTVWSPRPDWRSASRYFERQITRHEGSFIIFLDTPETVLNYYYSKFVKSRGSEKTHEYLPQLPVIHLKKYDKIKFLNFLSRNKIETFYLIHNRTWQVRLSFLFKIFIEDSRFQLLDKTSFKGIDIFKFHILT